MDIEGKVVLITGESEGIGMEAAKAFAGRGAKVALAARSGEKLEEVAREIREPRQELEGDNIRVILVYPRLTETNFGKNTLGNQEERQRQRNGKARERKADSASFVAEKIVQAAIEEPEEQFMDR